MNNLSAIPAVAVVLATMLAISGSFCAIGAPGQSVEQHFQTLPCKNFPKPPLNLAAPALPPSVLDGRNLSSMEGSEVLQLAKHFYRSDEFAKAAVVQQWALSKGQFGQYDLACYLAMSNRKDEAFYWLQVAAMEEGFRASFANTDNELDSLKKDKRWPPVFQFIQACDKYWSSTGHAPKTVKNAWFTVPGPIMRTNAIGAVSPDESAVNKKLFSDNRMFGPIPEPLPFDWLSVHHEQGQTFDEFRKLNPQKLKPGSVIYLQPFGKFPADASPPVESIRQFVQAYFQLETRVLKPTAFATERIDSRVNPNTKKRQYLTLDIHKVLAEKKPTDAYAVLGLTMEDITNKSSSGKWWNYVFGQADMKQKVAVYSFARFDPRFFGRERPRDFQKQLLRSTCATIAHETGHMFGLPHCTFYHCVMNGSNNLSENENTPLHLCPVDLRKLYSSIAFDTVKRYRSLRDFYQANAITDEVDWLNKMLAFLSEP